MSGIDYSDVTEAHGNQITREALAMMCTRYVFAARLSDGRDVLEVGCGAGQGLGVLRERARRVNRRRLHTRSARDGAHPLRRACSAHPR
jgi:protein-L-isoaspartate O-methyltransferase